MKVRISTSNGDVFFHDIQDHPQEIGGEGRIYPLYSRRYGDCFLKIYLNQAKANANKAKVCHMLSQHPPFVHERIRYCWPIGLVQDERGAEFLGFMMQAAQKGSRSLALLANYTIGGSLRDEYPDEDWYKYYELRSASGFNNRMKVLKNLAWAIAGLHRLYGCCIVDLKPENILITLDGGISVIDIDSIQIRSRHSLYKATAYTPNYFPADGYARWKSGQAMEASFDSFAFGCCAYMILTGTHPYSNVLLQPPYDGDEYHLISTRIKAGLYLRGRHSMHIRRVDPSIDLHANYDRMPECLQRLFDRTFSDVVRPTMDEWRQGLKSAITKHRED